ncbi:class I SAM-dependent methyltransferase [Glaciihabitans sp. dw_435]|uniref:class I SAM-dependent methyltransferase n=1 Tax=Glaciihabitans sp. dw_435 TaxID=2720081 RepID=UPI001BD4CF79|nr:class I SAM-dependent methyltransferase [Glaciihabitans sp. dw_435]
MTNEFWEARYTEAARTGSTIWSLDPNLWIADVTGQLTPGTAVDLGAGEGRNALWLASLGWSVAAVDFSPAGLAIGRSRAESIGVEVEWVEADATAWVSPRPVDLVVMAYLQLSREALARVIRNAADSLRSGGTLALIGHDRSNLTAGFGGPQDATLLSTPDELRTAADAAGLTVVSATLYDRVTADGHVAIDSTLIATKPAPPPPRVA